MFCSLLLKSTEEIFFVINVQIFFDLLDCIYLFSWCVGHFVSIEFCSIISRLCTF